jgi:hypothetical protein
MKCSGIWGKPLDSRFRRNDAAPLPSAKNLPSPESEAELRGAARAQAEPGHEGNLRRSGKPAYQIANRAPERFGHPL